MSKGVVEEPAGLGFAGQSGEPRICSKETAAQHSSVHPAFTPGQWTPCRLPAPPHVFSELPWNRGEMWGSCAEGRGGCGSSGLRPNGRICLGCRAKAVSLGWRMEPLAWLHPMFCPSDAAMGH